MSSSDAPRLPLCLKLFLTAFACLLVPVYFNTYGAANFLWFCDVALFLTLTAVWLESSLLASMAAVGIIMLQTIWTIDLVGICLGVPQSGGIAGYMFNSQVPLLPRLISLFHVWLPPLLVWMTLRLGYDKRALLAMTLLCWAVLIACFLLIPAGPPPADNPNQAVNVNLVFGPNEKQPQQWMHPVAWLALLMIATPLIAYVPVHFALAWADRRWGLNRP